MASAKEGMEGQEKVINDLLGLSGLVPRGWIRDSSPARNRKGISVAEIARSHNTETHKDSAMAVCDLEREHLSIGCSRREVDFGRFGKIWLLLPVTMGAKFLVEGRASFRFFYS